MDYFCVWGINGWSTFYVLLSFAAVDLDLELVTGYCWSKSLFVANGWPSLVQSIRQYAILVRFKEWMDVT